MPEKTEKAGNRCPENAQGSGGNRPPVVGVPASFPSFGEATHRAAHTRYPRKAPADPSPDGPLSRTTDHRPLTTDHPLSAATDHPTRVTLFGEMQFFPGGAKTPVIVRFDTQKSRLLFAYLLRSPGQGHSREVLATKFWPESPAAAARRSLRDALRFVRLSLAEQGIPHEAIESDRNTIRLKPGAFTTDAADFDAAQMRAVGRLAASDADTRRIALEEMVSPHRQPFLMGCFDLPEAEEWIEPARRRYADAFDDALNQLCTLYAGQGELRQALLYARMAAENAPSDETRLAQVLALTERVREEEQGYLHQLLPPKRQGASGGNRPQRRAYLETVGERNAFIDPRTRAMEQEDYERALGQLRAALVDAETTEERLALAERLLFLGRSSHLRDKGEGAITIAACEEAYAIYQDQGIASEAADALLFIANAALLRGNRARSIASLEVAKRIISDVERETIRYDLLTRVGEFLVFLGEYREGQAVLEDALRYFRQSREHAFLYGAAFCLRFLGMAVTALGDHTNAKAYLTESAQLLVGLDEPQTRAAVLGSLGDVYQRDGDARKALPLYQEGLREWEKIGQAYWTSNFKGRLARAYLTLATEREGRERLEYEKEAERLAEESLDHLDGSNGPVGRALPLYVLGIAALQRSNYRKAEVAFGECLALRRRLGDPMLVSEALEGLALYHRSVGDPESAVPLLRESLELRAQAGTPVSPRDEPWVTSLLRALDLLSH